jgi:pimeloyl-ACP methyl ester carboxylesterase
MSVELDWEFRRAERGDAGTSGADAGADADADAVPLVLLHAFPLDRSMWREVAALLATSAPTTPLILLDLPGLGRSPVPDGVPDLAVSADGVAGVLDAAGVDRAVLAGVSMGGYVAMAFARRHLDRLAGLALIDTKASADGEAARANRERVAQAVLGEAGASVLEPMLEGLLGATTRASRPDVVARVREAVLAARPDGVAWSQRAMASRPDSQEVLRALRIPVAVVVGEEDTLSPLPDAEGMAAAMADAMPGAALTVVPGAGHLAVLEDPPPVAAALTTLLSRL